jgi:DeoR/GlpR family transcriptional regulator of sugar metabolism
LIELEAKGVLQPVHGGAISLQLRGEVLDFNRLSVGYHEEKARKMVASAVHDGETVIFGGTPDGQVRVPVAPAVH